MHYFFFYTLMCYGIDLKVNERAFVRSKVLLVDGRIKGLHISIWLLFVIIVFY